MTEPPEIRLKRLLFRSWHRGMREADLLLGPFAERHLAELGPRELDRYEALLAERDDAICAWLVDEATPPPEHEAMLGRIRSHRLGISAT
jgi:antitoxin CptB